MRRALFGVQACPTFQVLSSWSLYGDGTSSRHGYELVSEDLAAAASRFHLARHRLPGMVHQDGRRRLSCRDGNHRSHARGGAAPLARRSHGTSATNAMKNGAARRPVFSFTKPLSQSRIRNARRRGSVSRAGSLLGSLGPSRPPHSDKWRQPQRSRTARSTLVPTSSRGRPRSRCDRPRGKPKVNAHRKQLVPVKYSVGFAMVYWPHEIRIKLAGKIGGGRSVNRPCAVAAAARDNAVAGAVPWPLRLPTHPSPLAPLPSLQRPDLGTQTAPLEPPGSPLELL